MRKLALASVLLAAILPAFAAVETTTVNGTVNTPSGAVATGGTITATLSQSGTALDGAVQVVVNGRVAATISGAGAPVGLVLVPNDAITPSGTYYIVDYVVTAPTRVTWREKWSVTTAPDPVNIGAITKLDVAPGISAPAAYGLLQDEGTPVTQRTTVNMIGAGVSCVDNAGNLRTDCTFSGGGGTPGSPDTGVQVNVGGAFGTVTGFTANTSTGEVGTKLLNNARIASKYATGGTGAAGTPWTGWESVLASDTVIRFPAGRYEVPNSSPTIPTGAKILCDRGAIFQFRTDKPLDSTPMFLVAAGAANVTVDGCEFYAGQAITTAGLGAGQGNAYIIVGTVDGAAVTDLRITNNDFGPAHISNTSGMTVFVRSPTVGLFFSGNTLDFAIAGFGFSNSSTAVPVHKDVSIVDNTWNYFDVQLGPNMGYALQFDVNAVAFKVRLERMTVSNNRFYNVNGVMGGGTGATGENWVISNNVAKGGDLDGFFGHVPVAGTFVDHLAITGNSCVGDDTIRDGVDPSLGSCQIKVAYARGVTVVGNTLYGVHQATGIDLANAVDFVVASNEVTKDNPDYLIEDTCYTLQGSTGNINGIVEGNLCVDPGDQGFRFLQGPHTRVAIRNNLVIGSQAAPVVTRAYDFESPTFVDSEFTGNRYEGQPPTIGVHNAPATELIQWGNSATAGDLDWRLAQGAFDTGHLVVGSTHLWQRAAGRFHVKSSTPASATDGNELVRGPASATDNALARWDLTSGGLLQNSTGATLDDSGNLTATSFIGPVTGNASSATILAANGGNCTPGQSAGGVSAAGVAEDCLDPIVSTEIDTSAEVAAIVGDETGSGALVFGTGPTITSPLTVSGGSDGTRGIELTDNTATCADPASGNTSICTIAGRVYRRDTGGAATLQIEAADIDTSAEVANIVGDETGTGAVVLAASPALTGNPTVPTASVGDNDTSAASTAFVRAAALESNTTTVTVCASGCDYTGIQAALDGTTSSASAPVQILVMPGTFSLGASGISVDAGTDSYKSVIGWSRDSVKLTTGDNTTHTFFGNTASFASADLIQFRVANMTIEHTTDSSAFEFQNTDYDHRFEVFANNLLIIGDNQPVLISGPTAVSQTSEPCLFVIANSEMVGDTTGMSLSNALVTYSSNNRIRRNTTTAGTASGFTGILTAYSYAGSALYSTGDTIQGYYHDTSSSSTSPTSCTALSLGGGPETVRISGMTAECKAKSGFTSASYGAMVQIGSGVGIGRETGDAIISDSTFTYTATVAGQGMYGLWMNGENDRVTLRNVEFRRGWGAGTEVGFAGNSSPTGTPTILLDRVSYDDSTLAAAYRVQNLVPTVQYVQLPASQSVGLPATGAAFDVNNEFRLFDAAADENASWRTIRLPDSLEVPSLYAPAFKLYWRTATATTGNVVWNVGVCVATADDPWPCTVSSFTAVTASAVVSAAGDLVVTSGVLPSGAFTAGNRALAVTVKRDADNGSDTMTGDAELVAAEISYGVK